MRYMIIVKNDPQTEQTTPTPGEFEAMGRFNQSLVDAGVLLAAEGLTASKDGARVTFKDGKQTVKDGPFTEARELVAGFWIVQVKSLDEAVAWARRIPFDNGATVEIRRVAEAADFEGLMSPDEIAREEAMRAQITSKAN